MQPRGTSQHEQRAIAPKYENQMKIQISLTTDSTCSLTEFKDLGKVQIADSTTVFHCCCCNSYAAPAEVCSRVWQRGGDLNVLIGTPRVVSVDRANAILTTEMHGLPLLQVVAVAMLILANAFFVAAEFAMVTIRDTRIEQMLAAGVPGARAVRRLQHDLDYFLPAVQLGVTLCSLASAGSANRLPPEWFSGGSICCRNRRPTPRFTPTSPPSTAVALGFALITYFHVTGRRTGAQVAGPAPRRSTGRRCRPSHAHLHARWPVRPSASSRARPPSSCAASISP